MTNHVAGAARANEEERERAKGRAFSTEEDVTLRKARWQPGWTWKEITSQLPGRSERATRDRWTRLQQQDARVGGEGSAPPGSYPPARVFWSAQEDATIRKARAEPGWSWKGITSQLPGRSKEAARERWRLLRQQDAQVGEGGSAPPGQMVWSAQEDDTLSKALGQPGWTWMGIASQLPGRSEKAARERWIRLRDQQAAPRQGRSWNAQEDATLLNAREQPGCTWKGIASQLLSQLPGRSEKAAKERWKRLQRVQSRQTAGEEERETEEGSGTEEGRETEEWRGTEEGRETEAGSGTEEGRGTVEFPVWSAREDDTLRQGVEELGCRWHAMASRLPGRSEEGIRARWTSKLQQTAEARQGASGGSSSAVVTTESADGAGGETASAHKRQRTTLTQHRRTTQSVTPASLSPLSQCEGRVLTFGDQPVAAEIRAQKRRAATYEAVAPSEERASKIQSRQEESVSLTAPIFPVCQPLRVFPICHTPVILQVDRERRRVSRGSLKRVRQEYDEQLAIEIDTEMEREIAREVERQVEEQIDTDVETDIEMEHDIGNETEIERGSDTEIEDGYITEIEREIESNIETNIEKEIEKETDTRVVATPVLVAEPVLITPASAVAMPLGGAVATTRRAVAETQPQSVSATNADGGLSAQEQWLLVNTRSTFTLSFR